MDAAETKPRQFSMRRLLVVTSVVAAMIAAGMAAGAPPVIGISLAIIGIGLAAFILLTEPQTWLLTFGTFFGFVIVVALGSLLYRSPLPAFVAAGLAAMVLFTWVKRRPQEKRVKAMIVGLLALTTVVAFPYLVRWRHHRAEYVVWKSGVSIHRYPHDSGAMSHTLGAALGPFLAPFRSDMRLADDPVRWGGIKFDDQKIIDLAPHFESLRGSYDLCVANFEDRKDPSKSRSPDITDKGLGILAKIPNLRGISVVSDRISNDGMRQFQQWDSVESLSLRCPQLDDEIIDWVVKFRKLNYLSLSGTQLTDDGLRRLVDGLNLTESRFQINVSKDSISQETINELQARLPAKTFILAR